MFSVIMAGDDSRWDVSAGEPHNDTFPLSRFLEYTDEVTAASFKPITASNLTYLESIPALFMSEIRRDDQRNDVITIRIGSVSNLSVVGGEIHYTFELLQKFPNVLVPDREVFRKALRMDKFELHRTHWAIKSADLSAGLSVIFPNTEKILGAAMSSAPPAPIIEQVESIETLQEFMAIVLALGEKNGEEIFYRGHSDHTYLLAPSLFRRNEAGSYKYLPKEEVMVRELLSVQDAQFSNDRSMLGSGLVLAS